MSVIGGDALSQSVKISKHQSRFALSFQLFRKVFIFLFNRKNFLKALLQELVEITIRKEQDQLKWENVTPQNKPSFAF